jgi:hypothetical protein
VLPRLLERLPVQRQRVDLQQHAAEPLHRLDLHPLGAAGPAGRLDRPHVTGERLGTGQPGQVVNAAVGGVLPQRRQQRRGRQLGAWIGAQQRPTALLAGRRVEAAEHRPDLLGGGDPGKAAGGGGRADVVAW